MPVLLLLFFPGSVLKFLLFPKKTKSFLAMEEESIDLRCNRSDGKQWRCGRPVMNNKKFCQLHYLQAKHRQYKQKVPESIKLLRKPGSKSKNKNGGSSLILKKNGGSSLILKKKKKRRLLGFPMVEFRKVLEKLKFKKGDLQVDLIKLFLQRQIGREKERTLLVNSNVEDEGEKLIRDLPNGFMSISLVPVRNFDNVGLICERKLGIDSGSLFRHTIRSKNLEPLPIGTLKVVPYKQNLVDSKKGIKRICHRCQRSKGLNLIRCSSCRKESFCMDCIEKWSTLVPKEVKISCLVCRGSCNCKTCSCNPSEDRDSKGSMEVQNNVNKILQFHRVLCLLLPVLKQLNKEQRIELEIEAKMKGKSSTEILIQQAICDSNEQLYCNNCRTAIVDFHRSCPRCFYHLCLSCCQEIRSGTLPGGIGKVVYHYPNKGKSYIHGGKPLFDVNIKQRSSSKRKFGQRSLPEWRANENDGTISCPTKDLGGCSYNVLDLRCVFPLNWAEELEMNAEEIACSYDFPETVDASNCYLGKKHGGFNRNLLEAATREESDDNFLYFPNQQDIEDEIEHFHKHLSKGQPIIVRNVLQSSSGLSWDPIVMFKGYLEKNDSKNENDMKVVRAIDCLDWCEVEIGVRQFLDGYLEGRMHLNRWPEMLRVKEWPSPEIFQEEFTSHNAELVRALPFQEYTNPISGRQNLTTKLPKEFLKPTLCPRMYISYGIAQELGRGDSVTKLSYNGSDMVRITRVPVQVNILTHTTDVVTSVEQNEKIKKLKKKHLDQNERESFKLPRNQKMVKKAENGSCLSSEKMEETSTSETPTSCLSPCDHISENHHILLKDESLSGNGCSGQNGEESYEGNSCLEESKERLASCGKSSVSNSPGVQWDVFRREDIPQLEEYLRIHSNEFRHTYCSSVEHVSHPIFDECFFLDSKHKRKLKEEFKVEPWTFYQRVGEAVVVPAGCPYQWRNLKSCVNVEMDFMSPENANTCIKLIDEVRLLPQNHRAKLNKLEVKKMSIYSISAAIKGIRELTPTALVGSVLMKKS